MFSVGGVPKSAYVIVTDEVTEFCLAWTLCVLMTVNGLSAKVVY